jgi:hypothetical protein
MYSKGEKKKASKECLKNLPFVGVSEGSKPKTLDVDPSPIPNIKQKGQCHTLALPFTLKSIFLRQKKNYENSNISPCRNIIFKKKIL